jgi:hypothetical protein
MSSLLPRAFPCAWMAAAMNEQLKQLERLIQAAREDVRNEDKGRALGKLSAALGVLTLVQCAAKGQDSA